MVYICVFSIFRTVSGLLVKVTTAKTKNAMNAAAAPTIATYRHHDVSQSIAVTCIPYTTTPARQHTAENRQLYIDKKALVSLFHSFNVI